MSTPCRLDGRGVLVTRPVAQAESLCRMIESLGGRPVPFPTVEILPASDTGKALALLREHWDIVIFISRNSVEQSLALMPDGSAGLAALLARSQLAAVGKATATAMQDAGIGPQLVPATGFDSEALLALPALKQVRGRRALIVRGEGGRALLGETLAARGAEVAFAEVYRRVAPHVDATTLIPEWQASLQFLTATSDEVLTNLLGILPRSARPWLFGLPLAVLSERNAATAMELGFRTVAVAGEPSDTGLCDALCRLSLVLAEGR